MVVGGLQLAVGPDPGHMGDKSWESAPGSPRPGIRLLIFDVAAPQAPESDPAP